MRTLFTTIILVGILISAGFAQESAEELFQSALYLEEVEGNLDEAIKIYQKIVAEFKDNRPMAAKALIQLGKCYEKMGNMQAERAYTQVINDFSDQFKQVSEARRRLSALSRPRSEAADSDISLKKIGSAYIDLIDLSSDGRYIVYVHWDSGNEALYDLETGKHYDITKDGTWRLEHGGDISEWGEGAVFSRDGKKIAYIWYKSEAEDTNQFIAELRTVGTDGSDRRILLTRSEGEYAQPLGWSKDGKHILTYVHGQNHKLCLVSAENGMIKVLKEFGTNDPGGLAFSPDDRYIIYTQVVEENPWNSDIFLMSSDGSNERRIVKSPSRDYNPCWLPDGRGILFMSQRSGNPGLWYQEIVNGEAKGESKLIKDSLNRMQFLGISLDNRIFFRERGQRGDVFRFSLDPDSGKVVEPVTNAASTNLGSNDMALYTKDGSLIYLSGNRNTLKIENMESGEFRDLKLGLGVDVSHPPLRLFPDEKSFMCYGGNSESGRGPYEIDLSTGKVTFLAELDEVQFEDFETSSEKNKIYLIQNRERSDNSVVLYDMSTQSSETLYRVQGDDEQIVGPLLYRSLLRSPDGKYIACYDRRGFIVLIPTSGEEPIKFQLPDTQIRDISYFAWSHDGTYLYFTMNKVLKEKRSSEVWRVNTSTGTFQNLGVSVDQPIRYMTIHPNGKDIVFTVRYSNRPPTFWVMENFLLEFKNK